MKKFLFVFAVLGATALGAFAQTTASSSTDGGTKISLGIEGGIPVGDANSVYNYVLGGSLKIETPILKNTFLTLSAGYNAFFVKSELKDPGLSSAYGFIPLKAGIKYYMQDGFFVEGEAGIVFSTEANSRSLFVYAPGVGYTFSDGFEVGLRFEGWPKDGETISQIGLRLALRF
jgi:hypothetical protein